MTKENIAAFKVAFPVFCSIFIMGYVNGIAVHTDHLGAFVTPQTGNVLWIGFHASLGHWSLLAENLGLFFGFISGIIFSMFTNNIFKNKTFQYCFNWSIFAVIVSLYPFVVQYRLHTVLAFYLLGFASGSALTCFRKVFHLDINSAMATGNVRFLGVHFAGAFLKKNKAELSNFIIFILCVFLFAFGSFVYGKMYLFDYAAGRVDYSAAAEYFYVDYSRIYVERVRHIDTLSATNFALVFFCIIPYFFATKNTTKEVKSVPSPQSTYE